MRSPALAVLAVVATGCVPSSQELRAPVDRLVRQRLGASLAGGVASAADAQAQVDALLARPVDMPAAIRIALANSPRLAAAFDELDIAAGEVAAALGIGPVAIDAKLRFGSPHDEREIEAIQGLAGLLTLPGRRAAAGAELAAARATAAAAALRLAARVEIAFDDLLAAQQDVELRSAAFDAADAAAALRERMHAAGNTTDLALARDRDAREQAQLELSRARAGVVIRHEAMNALLGLSGSRTWTPAGALRELPAAPPQSAAFDALEASALASSLELAADRERRSAAEHRRSTEAWRAVLPEIGVGVAAADDGRQTGVGPAVQIGLPLFDQRRGERARAAALVRRADHALEAQRLALTAAIRTARATALASYDEARRLRDVVLPLRQQILDETLKHYNAMNADPFALIAARQGLVDAQHQYLDAVRRYWNAMAEINALTSGVMLDPVPAISPASDEPR